MSDSDRQAALESVVIEVLVARESLGALAARCGLPVPELQSAIRRQALKGGKPRLQIEMRNQTAIDQAIRRAVRRPGGEADLM